MATSYPSEGLFSTCLISAGAYVAEFGGLHEVTSSTKGERIHVRLVGGGTTFMGWKNAPTPIADERQTRSICELHLLSEAL